MGFTVPVTVRLVPGDNTFTLLLDAQDRLHDYGWTDVTMDHGPAGKITTVENRLITFYLNGKPEATDANASSDVKDALQNVGAWKHVISGVAVSVQQRIQDESNAVVSSAENAALAPAKAAAKGAIIVGVIALLAIGVTAWVVLHEAKG